MTPKNAKLQPQDMKQQQERCTWLKSHDKEKDVLTEAKAKPAWTSANQAEKKTLTGKGIFNLSFAF